MLSGKTNADKWQAFGAIASRIEKDGQWAELAVKFEGGKIVTLRENVTHKF